MRRRHCAVLLGALRDELHRLAAEMAEDVAMPERHDELAGRLRGWVLA
ncbi:MAG: hypothetical protein M3R63_20965 [Actinomycetota bacterium]|nr:hypothetical protein [Actinomycetota bacterium]